MAVIVPLLLDASSYSVGNLPEEYIYVMYPYQESLETRALLRGEQKRKLCLYYKRLKCVVGVVVVGVCVP